MAYLRDIPRPRCQRCRKPARVELVNRYNAPCGAYCSRCGRKAVRELQAREGVPVGIAQVRDTN